MSPPLAPHSFPYSQGCETIDFLLYFRGWGVIKILLYSIEGGVMC